MAEETKTQEKAPEKKHRHHPHVTNHYEAIAIVDAHVYAIMERKIRKTVHGEERDVKCRHIEEVVTPEDREALQYALSFSHDNVVKRLAKKGIARLNTPMPPNAKRRAPPAETETQE